MVMGGRFLVFVSSVVPTSGTMRLEAEEKNRDEICDGNGAAYIGTLGVYSKKMGSGSAEMQNGSFTMKFKIRSGGNGNSAKSFN
jgi:hypothetical protein